MADLKVITSVVGMVNTNCHILYNAATNEALIIDAPDKADFIGNIIEENSLKPLAIFLTHGHFDHILAVDALREKYNIPVYAYKDEKEILNTPEYNTPFRIPRFKDLSVEADIYLEDNEVVKLLGTNIRILHTPGHTKGSACFYIEENKILFSGDTIFYQSYGRTDFYSGDIESIKNSIQERLFKLPEETLIYTGHMQNTSIKMEKLYNPIIDEI